MHQYTVLGIHAVCILFLFILCKVIDDGDDDKMYYCDAFNNTGNAYHITKIINPDLSLNLQAYEQYSSLFLATETGLCGFFVPSSVFHSMLI